MFKEIQRIKAWDSTIRKMHQQHQPSGRRRSLVFHQASASSTAADASINHWGMLCLSYLPTMIPAIRRREDFVLRLGKIGFGFMIPKDSKRILEEKGFKYSDSKRDFGGGRREIGQGVFVAIMLHFAK